MTSVSYDRLRDVPWIEKYRPRHIDDLLLEENTLSKIKKFIKDKDMPNLIIPGTPGIGKTTTIKCIARELYGPNAEEAVLELNASDDRGIKAVIDIITNFCTKKMDLNDNLKEKKYAEHKMIFLDEADNMTETAQLLINNLMDKYHETTRFAFTCNTSSDILEGIQSRCIIMRFFKLKKDFIVERLKYICEKENVKYIDNKDDKNKENALDTIAVLSQGDLRSAINNLQLVYNAFKLISDENIYNICDKPQPVLIRDILSACLSKNVAKAIDSVNFLKKKGFLEADIILGLFRLLKMNDPIIDILNMQEEKKIKLLEIICNYAVIISKGINTNLQLIACVCEMIKI